jgi:N-acetylmuramoyl-L-alanine amidase
MAYDIGSLQNKIPVSQLNAAMGAIKSTSGLKQIGAMLPPLQGQHALANMSVFKTPGESLNGIQALMPSSNDFPGDVSDAASMICEIGSVPGLETDLVGQFDSDNVSSKLNALVGAANTGVAAGAGVLNKIISSGTPAAITDSLKTVTGKPASQLTGSLGDIIPPGAISQINKMDDLLGSGLGVSSGLVAKANSIISNITNAVGDITGSLIGDLNLKLDLSIGNTIANLINFNGADFNQNDILGLLAGKKYDQIIELGKAFTNAPKDIFENSINALTLDPSKTIAQDNVGAVGEKTIPCYVIGSNDNTWSGADTAASPTQFTFVSGKEELQAEFKTATRLITEVVTHWTATYTNQDIGAEHVHSWHQDRGFSGIGYHYIIRRDGRLQRGRPINKAGAHALDNGHNKYSIGISFAAGYNCPSGTANPDRFISVESINSVQFKTYDMFMSAFYDIWPGGQVYGHVDTDNKGKVDPGFDVQDYCFTKFGKKNINLDGKIGPLSPIQIASGNVAPEATSPYTAPQAEPNVTPSEIFTAETNTKIADLNIEQKGNTTPTEYADMTDLSNDVIYGRHKVGTKLSLINLYGTKVFTVLGHPTNPADYRAVIQGGSVYTRYIEKGWKVA